MEKLCINSEIKKKVENILKNAEKWRKEHCEFCGAPKKETKKYRLKKFLDKRNYPKDYHFGPLCQECKDVLIANKFIDDY